MSKDDVEEKVKASPVVYVPEVMFLLGFRTVMLISLFVLILESVVALLVKYWMWLWRVIP